MLENESESERVSCIQTVMYSVHTVFKWSRILFRPRCVYKDGVNVYSRCEKEITRLIYYTKCLLCMSMYTTFYIERSFAWNESVCASLEKSVCCVHMTYLKLYYWITTSGERAEKRKYQSKKKTTNTRIKKYQMMTYYSI